MAKSRRRVGIVGLGIMGGAFARNLAAAGWRVIGYDIDPAPCRSLKRAGIEIVHDAAGLAGEAPTIITSLPDPKALHETVAAIVSSSVRRVVIETSTFALDDKLAAERTLRKAGHIMLDCPISGTGSQARMKDVVVYASGDRLSIRRLRSLFLGFARAIHDLGPFGNGSRMKYVANHLVAVHNVATAEAMVLGMKAGLDPQTVLETVRSGAGNSRVFELRAPLMVRQRYDDPTMKVAVWQKDMKVIAAFAQALGVPTPVFSATQPIYDKAMASGYAGKDTAVVCAVMETMAGVKRERQRPRP
jgi:3-hydroxyisobutyrate dehydrogenase-like beta-hydroxyacid dehydrogenase